MKPVQKIAWLDDVAVKDFDAALAYLSLRFDEDRAGQLVDALKAAPVTTRRVNDILRACRHDPLPLSDPGVRREKGKKRLSPVLVISFEYGGDIADGYHRLSYAYHVSPYQDVPLRIASARLPGLPGQ